MLLHSWLHPLSSLPQQPLPALSSLSHSFVEAWSPGSALDHGTTATIADAAAAARPLSVSAFLRPEATLPPLNASSELWVRRLVWQDFRLAVALFVVVPLGLLAWAVAARVPSSSSEAEERSEEAETVLRCMTSYWQASSLLLLTVALNVQESNLGVFAGLLAQAMIVVSLFWWEDLNRELASMTSRSEGDDDDGAGSFGIAQVFVVWRVAAGVSAAYGVGVQALFQRCNLAPSLAADAYCAPWLEPPQFAAGVVGLRASPALGGIAFAGCALYLGALAYYALVLVPAVGRDGRAPRPGLMDFTPIGAWTALGFLDPPRDRDEI